jgi:hypothetical protein
MNASITKTTGRDCRADFRLHCLDLNYLVDSEPAQRVNLHWLNGDSFYGPMVERVRKDWAKVQDLGGQLPIDPLTADGVIAVMGFAQTEEPSGTLASIALTARITAACCRESLRAQRAANRQRAAARPRAAIKS